MAIMGTDCGDIIFISLTTGLQVGITFIQATIAMLHICQDDSLDSVFLLVSVDLRFIFYNVTFLSLQIPPFYPLYLVVTMSQHKEYNT